MANQPPHHSWRKRARRAAAGEKQGEQWPDHGREGSWHRLVAEEMMEEEGRRLWCCTILAMVVGDVFDFLCEEVQRQRNDLRYRGIFIGDR